MLAPFATFFARPSSTVADLEVYADKIGLAFQVADDILDCTATSEELGKTAGKDEAVDKATYVRLMGLDGARDEVRRRKRKIRVSKIITVQPFSLLASLVARFAHRRPGD